MLDLQNKRVEELQIGLVGKDTQEAKIKELEESLLLLKSSLNLQEEKSKGTQKELEETLEKLEKQREEMDKLQQQSNVRTLETFDVNYFNFKHLRFFLNLMNHLSTYD